MDNYKGTGRLRYIEPTNLNNNFNGSYSEDISHEYEDYCMSVDLTVRIVNRYSCGFAKDTGLERELNYSSSNGSISFLGGTKIDNSKDGYLTTNFTDISMTDPGTNTSECLGIESISITYNNWMHPMVVIKFIDVRGATVMQNNEAGYYNPSDLGFSRQLYKSLFTFPYPMFVLRVKGYYGKGATYNLSVSKTDIEMDSENGNFIITVSLIGYMYGIFSDIPMTYIAAAPYTSEGDKYWNDKIQDGTFIFKDSAGNPAQKMIKIPDLRLKVAMAASNEESISAASEGKQKLTDNDEQIELLNNLGDLYPIDDTWLGKKEHTELKYYFLLSKDIENVRAVKKKFSDYYDMLVSYDNNYKTSHSKTFSEFKKFKTSDDIDFFTIKYVINDENILRYLNKDESKYKEVIGITNYEDIINKYIEDNRKNYKSFYLCFLKKGEDGKYSKFLENNKKTIDSIQEAKTENEKKYKSKEMAIIEKILGFKPSIRNIYELIFAHMETFMHCFYKQTGVIREQIQNGYEYRTKAKQNVSDEYTDTERSSVDIAGNKTLSNFLPPYTAYYQDIPVRSLNENKSRTANRKEMVWPEEVCKFPKELEELHFIKDLLSGAELYYKKSYETDKLIERLQKTNSTGNSHDIYGEGIPNTFISGFIPLTAYDYVYKDIINNPYIEIKRIAEQTNSIESVEGAILGLFALRAFNYMSNSLSNSYLKHESFGTIEALNFYKAVGDSSNKAILNFILKYGNMNDYKSFINDITNGNETKVTNTWRFGLNNTTNKLFENYSGKISYSLHKSNQKFLPVGVYNFNTIKNDYINENNLKNNSSYIPTSIPFVNELGEVDGELENINTFFLFENRDYIKNIIINVEDEINTSAEYLKSNKESFKGRDSSQYGDLVNKESVLSNYKNELENLLKDNLFDNSTIVTSDGTYVESNDLISVMSEGDLIERQKYYIKHPSKINEEVDKSLFLDKVYISQTSIYARAYLFLQSVPIKGYGNRGNIVYNNKNGVYPKVLLLREGSYYWYKDNMDELKMDGLYKKPKWNENLIGGMFECKYETLKFIDLNNNFSNYAKWKYPQNCTISRINYLKKYFQDWVDNKFRINEQNLTSEDYYQKPKVGYLKYNSLGLGLDIDLNLTNGPQRDSADKLQSFLRDLFFGVCTTFDLYSEVDKSSKELYAKESEMKNAFNGFVNELKLIYKDTLDGAKNDVSEESYIKRRGADETVKNPFKNNDLNLTTYMTLKSLYDKWLCSPQYGPYDTWALGKSKSDFNNFIYTDTFYHDIGYEFPINITKVSEWLNSCLPTSNISTTEGIMGYTGKTVLNFLTEVAQDSGGMLLALPQRFGSYDINSVKNMFTPYHLYSDWATDESSFVFMYTYKPSEHLGDEDSNIKDMNGYSQKGDGLNLTDEELMGMLTSDDGYTIPAFGVTYAKQNQSIFKNIRLSTADAGVTEAGLASTFNIASKASESPRETVLYGQDLYRVFSNYSYKCSVETMGNAQIMPLMFFQLNNVPMWKGGYQILRVNHEITAGNFSTTFEGIRINRHSIPLSDSVAITIKDTGSNEYNDNKEVLHTDNKNYDGMKGNSIDVIPNKSIILSDDIDFDEKNVTELKPIICITPAHGPNTGKKLEWEWSTKVVNNIVELLKKEKYYDDTPYNVQFCNRNGHHTKNYYSMIQTKNIINRYGSKNVISIVPHWNGGGGRRYEIYVDYEGRVRDDSYKLAECMASEVKNCVSDLSNFKGYEKCINNVIEIKSLPFKDEKKDDGAPRINCACILTENWFADCKIDGNSGSSLWENGKLDDLFYNWLNDDGIDVVAKMHVKAIKRYINSLG